MKTLLRYCDHCGEYSLHDVCPRCGNPTRIPVPPKFSPEDHYGKYRRMAKKEERLKSAPKR